MKISFEIKTVKIYKNIIKSQPNTNWKQNSSSISGRVFFNHYFKKCNQNICIVILFYLFLKNSKFLFLVVLLKNICHRHYPILGSIPSNQPSPPAVIDRNRRKRKQKQHIFSAFYSILKDFLVMWCFILPTLRLLWHCLNFDLNIFLIHVLVWH